MYRDLLLKWLKKYLSKNEKINNHILLLKSIYVKNELINFCMLYNLDLTSIDYIIDEFVNDIIIHYNKYKIIC